MIAYLWNNREAPELLSRRWFVVWAKRLLTMGGLLKIVFERFWLARKGVTVGDLSVVRGVDINGRPLNLKIGINTSLVGPLHIACHDVVEIGSHVTINSGVTILTASHSVTDPKWLTFKKPIYIKDYAWIATGAIILPGVTIGRGAVVGAGAVVTKDIPDYSIAIGNPATIKENKRCRSFEYNPVIFCAPYEAWVGKNMNLAMAKEEHNTG